MTSYRFSFWVLIFISFMNTIFMINTHENGIKAMGQIPLQLLLLLIGIILFFTISIKGIRLLFSPPEKRQEKEWQISDKLKLFLTMGLLLYNILIMWFLAR